MEFEVIDIREEKRGLKIEIELPNRERRGFRFPLGNGWEDEDETGEMKAIKKIANDLEREQKTKKPSKKKLKRYIGKRK